MVKQTVIGINQERGYAECWRLTPQQILKYMEAFNHRYNRWEIVPDHTWYKVTIGDFDKARTISILDEPMTVLYVEILKGNNPYVERRFFGKKKGL